MRVLVTGVTGFAGSHLADFILEKYPTAKVFGSIRYRSPTENIKHLCETSKVTLLQGDLTDPSSVRKTLDEAKPDVIFHLAAQSFVGASFGQPRETLATNINPTLNLLHGLREKLAGMIVFAGTSEEYGLVDPSEVPIFETHQLKPLSPYGVSKIAADLLCFQYHRSYGVNVVRSRAFNHEGPRRGEQFATSSFAKQIAEIEVGLRPRKIMVGNLDAVRDYTDVRDTVRAYWELSQKGQAGEVYNVCSSHCAMGGRAAKTNPAWRVGDMLDFLISLSGGAVDVIHDPERDRPSDVPLLAGDYSKLNLRTGWEPLIPFEKTLTDLLNYWREKIPAPAT